MATDKINYTGSSGGTKTDSSIYNPTPTAQKVTASDMNQIRSVVNSNADILENLDNNAVLTSDVDQTIQGSKTFTTYGTFQDSMYFDRDIVVNDTQDIVISIGSEVAIEASDNYTYLTPEYLRFEDDTVGKNVEYSTDRIKYYDGSSTRTLSFPSKTGTLALSSDTVNVTGNQNVAGQKTFTEGNDEFVKITSDFMQVASGGVDSLRIQPYGLEYLDHANQYALNLIMNDSSLDEDKSIVLPARNGTIALTSDISADSSLVKATGNVDQDIDGTKTFTDGNDDFVRIKSDFMQVANGDDDSILVRPYGIEYLDHANEYALNLIFNDNALDEDKRIALPAKSGIIALTSDISADSSLVKATGNVDQDIDGTKTFTNGNDDFVRIKSEFMQVVNGDDDSILVRPYGLQYLNNSNQYSLNLIFNDNSLDEDKSIALPAKSGTMALTSDIGTGFVQTLAIKNVFQNNTMPNIVENEGNSLKDTSKRFANNYGTDFSNWTQFEGNSAFQNSQLATVNLDEVVDGITLTKLADSSNTQVKAVKSTLVFINSSSYSKDLEFNTYYTFSFYAESKDSDSFFGIKLGEERHPLMFNANKNVAGGLITNVEAGDNDGKGISCALNIPAGFDYTGSGPYLNTTQYSHVEREHVSDNLIRITIAIKTNNLYADYLNVYLMPIVTNAANFNNNLVNTTTSGNNVLGGFSIWQGGSVDPLLQSTYAINSPFMISLDEGEKGRNGGFPIRDDGKYGWSNYDDDTFNYMNGESYRTLALDAVQNGQGQVDLRPLYPTLGGGDSSGYIDVSSLAVHDEVTVEFKVSLSNNKGVAPTFTLNFIAMPSSSFYNSDAVIDSFQPTAFNSSRFSVREYRVITLKFRKWTTSVNNQKLAVVVHKGDSADDFIVNPYDITVKVEKANDKTA